MPEILVIIVYPLLYYHLLYAIIIISTSSTLYTTYYYYLLYLLHRIIIILPAASCGWSSSVAYSPEKDCGRPQPLNTHVAHIAVRRLFTKRNCYRTIENMASMEEEEEVDFGEGDNSEEIKVNVNVQDSWNGQSDAGAAAIPSMPTGYQI